ncbi:MAG: GcrA family cell cycle regulator [Polymorphobacter sp.]|uniref:GcrA family cell cycle regulator n=1 Tax=Polymorphobacter sp. TaxID=1909290 RepID=UPI003A8A17F7
MAWTEERIAILKAGWEGGMTASQIAEQLGEGVTRNAVIGKAHRLGLESRPSPVKGGEEAAPAAKSPAPAAKEAAAKPAEAAAPAASSAPAATPAVAKPVAKPARRSGKAAKVSLLDLNERICKWPIGHPGEPDFHFCGKPVQAGFPYCSEHCALAYQAQMPRRDRDRRPPPQMPGMPVRR